MGSIYIIQNMKSGKAYIGSTTQIPAYRLRQHRKLLVAKKHDNPKLQNSFNKHGLDSFEFDILEDNLSNDNLHIEEKFWIEYFKYIGAQLYNINDPEKIRYGIPCSETTKEKIRNSLKGNKLSEETKIKIKERSTQIWGSPEGRSRMSDITSREWEGIVDPNGVIYSPIKHLKNFCKEHNLKYSGVRRMLQGKSKHYKKWTRVSSAHN